MQPANQQQSNTQQALSDSQQSQSRQGNHMTSRQTASQSNWGTILTSKKVLNTQTAWHKLINHLGWVPGARAHPHDPCRPPYITCWKQRTCSGVHTEFRNA